MRTTLCSMLASPLPALRPLSRVTKQCSKDRIFPDLAMRTGWSHDRPDFVLDTDSAVGVEIRVFCETAFSRDGLRDGPLFLSAVKTRLIARIVDDSRILVERPPMADQRCQRSSTSGLPGERHAIRRYAPSSKPSSRKRSKTSAGDHPGPAAKQKSCLRSRSNNAAFSPSSLTFIQYVPDSSFRCSKPIATSTF